MDELVNSRILGLGHHLPERAVTNRDLTRLMDTSEEWIEQRTGCGLHAELGVEPLVRVGDDREREAGRVLGEFGGRGVEDDDLANPGGFEFGAATFQSSYGVARLMAENGRRKAMRVYTNPDVARVNDNNGMVRYRGKTEQVN